MSIKPPKCKTCGAEEWRHVCGPRAGTSAAKLENLFAEQGVKVVDVTDQVREAIKPKTGRKEYLRLKAIERRARQKAAKATLS